MLKKSLYFILLVNFYSICFMYSLEGAEAALRELGSSWEWQAAGKDGDGNESYTLKTITATVPAVRTDNQPDGAQRSNRKTFFNSVVAAYTGWNDSRNEGKKAVLLGERRSAGGGDGSRLLDDRVMGDAVQVMQELSVAFKWHGGDVLLVDNRTVMHARNCFEGPRRILAALIRDPMR